MNIAIDGPAGAGKTTQAKALAQELGFTYVDTGALYRALAVRKLEYEKTHSHCPTAALLNTHITFERNDDGVQHVMLDGKDVTHKLRTPEVSLVASNLSALSEVRRFLDGLQRDIARSTSVVMEGRDIGTVILPDAEFKFFLTANPLVRAYRRGKELEAAGNDVDYIQLATDMAIRDHNDSTREASPLKKADDAIEIDCSEMSLDEVLRVMLEHIRPKSLSGMEIYEHPKGYRPNRKHPAGGVFIEHMKCGMQFTATDGRQFKVEKVTTLRCAGGMAEHDMWAKDLASGKTVLFHCPVGANPLRYTFLVE